MVWPKASGNQVPVYWGMIVRGVGSWQVMRNSLVSPLTQPVQRDGTTLYRARFAGFSDKEEARQACAKLKSKAFACLAVPN